MSALVTRSVLLLAVLVPSVLASACSRATMDIPADLAPAERLAVEGRGGWRTPKRIAFGDYEAAGVRRSATRGRGSGASIGRVGGSKEASRQSYGYAFREAGMERGRVDCEATASRGTINLPVVDVEAASGAGLACRLMDPAARMLWELTLRSRRDRHLEGSIDAGDLRLDIAATGPGGGGLVPAQRRGFELRRDGQVVAAVETVSRGAVWLAPGLAPADRAVVAGAALALLLYQDIGSD